jgi:hypothetical protein
MTFSNAGGHLWGSRQYMPDKLTERINNQIYNEQFSIYIYHKSVTENA